MKKTLLLFTTFFIAIVVSTAQLLNMNPAFITETSTNNLIVYDANFGNKGLLNYSGDVFVHIGVITTKSTSSSDWKYVNSSWGVVDANFKAAALGNNKWQFAIPTDLRNYFGITDAAERITRIAIIFRSGDGNIKGVNTDGSDMYVPVYDNNLHVRIDKPFWEPKYDITYPQNTTQTLNSSVEFMVNASQIADIYLEKNNSPISSMQGVTSYTASVAFTTFGNHSVMAKANSGTASAGSVTITYTVPGNSPVAEPPAGLKQGINYYANDPTKVTLVLFAPGKSIIRVMGDFNNWDENDPGYVMNKTADGRIFWITLSNLVAGQEYAYQYIIDESLKIADYNAEKVLDPWNDPYIDAATYPGLKPYPSVLNKDVNGIVSVLQTNKTVYNWRVGSFQRPQKEELRVYELLVRDFVAEHNWDAVKAKIGYIKSLGMNAIELMPFNEFEGNLSWGYNPNFYFAPDKYYGTETALKQFIDECHAQGIAVIMDMVLNHSFGSSPMVRMYWDAANNQPASNSPWFNQQPTHPFNVGYDFNHDSEDTKYFASRVMRYWLENYKIDGFRFDLSKGFTQRHSTDVAAWNQYDQNRINTWYRYYDSIQAVTPGAYCVLEHLGNDDEEIQLANKGMLLWENMNHQYNQLTMGWIADSDLNRSIYSNRGWTKNNMLLYMESHDEERLMYRNVQWGNVSGSYNVKDSATAYTRNAMAMAFWAATPGPKMIWQFGELGYPYSINHCGDNTVSDACRTDIKPIRWDYLHNPDRVKLKDAYAKMMKLRSAFPSTFINNYVDNGTNLGIGEGMIRKLVINSPELKIVVVGNFDITSRTTTITWPATGDWYPYISSTGSLSTLSVNGSAETAEKAQPNLYAFAGSNKYSASNQPNTSMNGIPVTVTTATSNITLQPGEFYVYTNQDLKALPVKITDLKVTQNKNSVNISWNTTKEATIKHYQIQRSTDAKNYHTIHTATPQKATVNTYSFTDENIDKLISKDIFYRIVITESDNQTTYSETKKITIQKSNATIIYPNPSNGIFKINFDNDNYRIIHIYDVAGKLIYKTSGNLALVNIDVRNKADGIYIVKITENNHKETYKIIKQ